MQAASHGRPCVLRLSSIIPTIGAMLKNASETDFCVETQQQPSHILITRNRMSVCRNKVPVRWRETKGDPSWLTK
jgi:hypothetical protein